MYNKITQKLLSIGVSTAMMLAMVPHNGASAAEPSSFVTSAKANHWGRSDLRAYLNNVEKTNNTLPINSTNSGSNAANYPSQFSKAEYGLVQPFTYSTNVLNGSPEATAVYETTDKFWLLSGNYSNNQIISWGAKDISANSQYSQTTTNDKDRIIPISYWSYGASICSWVRSPDYFDHKSLEASRGDYVRDSIVDHPNAAAAACKIHLESVIFASAASAASIAAGGGAKKIDISGSSNFGQKVTDALPDYGMYLKTSSSSSFSPTGLSLSGKNLTVNYSGGVANQYVVVHAFKADDLINGTSSYVAANKLAAEGTSATIDVSAWGLSSLNGYTIKVWMEDGSGSLAKATTPVTFVGTTKTEDGASTNARVFAMKADLQTSWGKLTNATDLVGANPTNQKIYFGEKDGKPLEFWIAGREDKANGGEISATGEIMTLYQAKSVETKQFNGYKENPTVALQDGQSITYTGSSAVYSGTVTYQNVAGANLKLPENNPTYQYSTDGGSTWTDGMPTNAGTYKIRAKVAANDNYESATSAPVMFTIGKATPTFIAPNPSAKEVYYGSKLGQAYSRQQLKDTLGSPKLNDVDIPGDWTWAAGDTHPTGALDVKTFKARFTPASGIKDNYDWSKVANWDSYYQVISVNVPIKVVALPIGEDAKIDLDSSSFTYNGKEQKPTITVKKDSFTTLVGGTDYDVTWPADVTTAGAKTVEITFKGNYSGTATTQYTINPAEITPSIKAENRDYNRTNTATVTVNFDGLVNEETLKIGTDYTIDSATFADANAGENKTVTATISLTESDKANNYQLSSTKATATADINKKAITVTAEDNTKIAGDTDPELTYTVDGLIEGDSLTGSLERDSGEDVGTYAINQGSLDNPNYAITFKAGTFTISEMPSYPDGPGDTPENPDDSTEVEQPSDRPEWGETMITIKGIKHYISKDGSRSVEISEKNTDANGIIWIKEESYDPYLGYDTAAWYGFDNSKGIFENGSRAYVHWYNKEQNPEKFTDIDETHEVEDNNCYYFEVGVIKPDGTSYAQLSEPIR